MTDLKGAVTGVTALPTTMVVTTAPPVRRHCLRNPVNPLSPPNPPNPPNPFNPFKLRKQANSASSIYWAARWMPVR